MKIASGALAAVLGAGTAHATDVTKAGKWAFAAQVQMPKLPKLPPGVALPPGINVGADAIKVTCTSCLAASKPVPDEIRPPSKKQGRDCKVEELDKAGSTVRWETRCKTPDATVHAQGEARYAGDRMEATIETTVTDAGGEPNVTFQHLIGHYLEPCDGK